MRCCQTPPRHTLACPGRTVGRSPRRAGRDALATGRRARPCRPSPSLRRPRSAALGRRPPPRASSGSGCSCRLRWRCTASRSWGPRRASGNRRNGRSPGRPVRGRRVPRARAGRSNGRRASRSRAPSRRSPTGSARRRCRRRRPPSSSSLRVESRSGSSGTSGCVHRRGCVA